MELLTALIGFIVGVFIGTSGMGGGMIMTPLLIFGLGVPPSIAVGSDLIFAAVTKIVGAWQHWKQKTIDFSLFKWVAMGSIPGSIAGMIILRGLQKMDSVIANDFITQALAVTFFITAVVMILQMFHKWLGIHPHRHFHGRTITIIGFFIGFIVSITSVGSGTLFVALLLYMYPKRISSLVGTDILHGVLITGFAGIAHAFLGSTNWELTLNLLIGSIPGVWIGSKLALKLPDHIMRMTLIVLLILTSISILIN